MICTKLRRLLPPSNEVGGKVICLQVCVCPQGSAIPACIAGGIPACLAAGLLGSVLSQHALQVVSQHALQQVSRGVSRPTPNGEVEGDLVQAHSQGRNWGGSGPGPQPRGKLRGIWSRPTAKGVVKGIWSGGCLVPGGVPGPGGAWSQWGVPGP